MKTFISLVALSTVAVSVQAQATLYGQCKPSQLHEDFFTIVILSCVRWWSRLGRSYYLCLRSCVHGCEPLYVALSFITYHTHPSSRLLPMLARNCNLFELINIKQTILQFFVFFHVESLLKHFLHYACLDKTSMSSIDINEREGI